MPTTNDRLKKSANPNPDDSDPEGHDAILAGISPADERRHLRKLRMWAKKRYGTPDDVLDEAYGLRSRLK